MEVVLPSTDFITSLLASSSVIITPHLGPDGDAVGSALALSLILKAKNIPSIILTKDSDQFEREKEKISTVLNTLCPSPTFPKAKNLFPEIRDEIQNSSFVQKLGKAPAHIYVDCSSANRIGSASTEIKDTLLKLNLPLKTLVIDHHQEPELFDGAFVDSSSPSTGNLMYRLGKATLGEIEYKPLVIAIFYAIASDTDSFRHLQEKDSETFEIAAELTKKGANPSIIYSAMHSGKTFFSVEYLSKILQKIYPYKDGKVLIAEDNRSCFLKYGRLYRPSNSVYDTLLSVKGTELVVFLKYRSFNTIEGSLRVPPISPYNASLIAKEISGGGGHEKAAGFTFKGTMKEALKRITDVLDKIENNN